MKDWTLKNWVPDFTVNKEDVCTDGAGHTFVEVFNDGHIQTLVCSKCGYKSIGWFNNKENM